MISYLEMAEFVIFRLDCVYLFCHKNNLHYEIFLIMSNSSSFYIGFMTEANLYVSKDALKIFFSLQFRKMLATHKIILLQKLMITESLLANKKIFFFENRGFT